MSPTSGTLDDPKLFDFKFHTVEKEIQNFPVTCLCNWEAFAWNKLFIEIGYVQIFLLLLLPLLLLKMTMMMVMNTTTTFMMMIMMMMMVMMMMMMMMMIIIIIIIIIFPARREIIFFSKTSIYFPEFGLPST